MQTEEYKTKTVKVLHCLRCGGEWQPRYDDISKLPKTCRFCNSPYWNIPRARKIYSKTKRVNTNL